jgi:hypothetical protein
VIDEPRPMKEIHEIQEKIYSETKDMTTQELLDYFHRATEEASRKFGLKVRRLPKQKNAA